jgi:hypothetical protein
MYSKLTSGHLTSLLHAQAMYNGNIRRYLVTFSVHAQIISREFIRGYCTSLLHAQAMYNGSIRRYLVTLLSMLRMVSTPVIHLVALICVSCE